MRMLAIIFLIGSGVFVQAGDQARREPTERERLMTFTDDEVDSCRGWCDKRGDVFYSITLKKDGITIFVRSNVTACTGNNRSFTFSGSVTKNGRPLVDCIPDEAKGLFDKAAAWERNKLHLQNKAS